MILPIQPAEIEYRYITIFNEADFDSNILNYHLIDIALQNTASELLSITKQSKAGKKIL